jgi:hypothetical protein
LLNIEKLIWLNFEGGLKDRRKRPNIR